MLVKKNLKEKVAFIFFIYWTTIIVVRAFIFQEFRLNSFDLAIFLKNVHIHHFLIGILFLTILFFLYFFKKGGELLRMVLLGSGLALIFDEFVFWTTFNFDTYWSIGNFLAIMAIGLFLLLLFIFLEKKSLPEEDMASFGPHKNPANPLVSLVIPALDEEKFLPKIMRSVLAQDYKNFELILVDNNSTDQTAKIAEDFGAKVVFEANAGVGSARQAGFKAAKGSIIATTDADVILPQGWLSRIVSEFEKDEKLAAFGGLYLLSSGSIVAKALFAFLARPVWQIDRILSGGWSLPGANLAVRKEAFWEIGGFRVDLGMNEDADLSQRLKRVGKVKLDPDFLVLTSGRRYRKGLWHGFLLYLPNWIRRMMRRDKFTIPSVVRTEKPLLGKFSFVPLLLPMIILFSFFYILNPSISQAKIPKLIKRDTARMGHVLAYHRAILLEKVMFKFHREN